MAVPYASSVIIVLEIICVANSELIITTFITLAPFSSNIFAVSKARNPPTQYPITSYCSAFISNKIFAYFSALFFMKFSTGTDKYSS